MQGGYRQPCVEIVGTYDEYNDSYGDGETINTIQARYQVPNHGARVIQNCNQIADLNYWNHEQSNRVYSTEGCSPTIRTKHDEAGTIKILNNNSKGYLEATEGDGVDISARMKYHRGTVQKDKAQTLTRTGGVDLGVVVK